MKKNADRFVHVVFCDDIRHEVGNKVSFMGCYQREMLMPVTPWILARLCIFVTVSTPVARPFKSLTLRVHQGANEVAIIEMPSEDVTQSLAPVQEGDTRIMANLGLTLAPLVLTELTPLRSMLGGRAFFGVFASINPSSVSTLSVSVGSIMSASATMRGK